MSKKTSFRLVISQPRHKIKNKDLRFSIGQADTTADILSELKSVCPDFSQSVIDVLLWIGCEITIYQGTNQHNVEKVIPALNWIKNNR